VTWPLSKKKGDLAVMLGTYYIVWFIFIFFIKYYMVWLRIW